MSHAWILLAIHLDTHSVAGSIHHNPLSCSEAAIAAAALRPGRYECLARELPDVDPGLYSRTYGFYNMEWLYMPVPLDSPESAVYYMDNHAIYGGYYVYQISHPLPGPYVPLGLDGLIPYILEPIFILSGRDWPWSEVIEVTIDPRDVLGNSSDSTELIGPDGRHIDPRTGYISNAGGYGDAIGSFSNSEGASTPAYMLHNTDWSDELECLPQAPCPGDFIPPTPE